MKSIPESTELAEAFLVELNALTKKYRLQVGMDQLTEDCMIWEADEGEYRFKGWEPETYRGEKQMRARVVWIDEDGDQS